VGTIESVGFKGRLAYRTRIRPVFRGLRDRDPEGASWLPSLMALGGHGRPPEFAPVDWHCFDRAIGPATGYDRWLIEEGLWTPAWQDPFDRHTPFLPPDREGRKRAVASLRGSWPKGWCPEIMQLVDCMLATESFLLYVRATRDEFGLEGGPFTSPYRSEVLAYVDIAWEESGWPDNVPRYVLLVTDDGDALDDHLVAASVLTDLDVVEAGLPHLSPSEREEAMQRYLGHTTWEAISEVTGIELPGD
jgi:hypothetical protein